jgi:outer membrane receptor protein involved in Fe transport
VIRVHLYVCLIGAALYAQVHTASLTGLVTDPTGAVISDARVTARNLATNVELVTQTDASGYYTLPALQVGVYEVSVEKQGFKKAVATNVELVVGQKARLDFRLDLGTLAESVTVEAGAPLLATEEASLGSVVENPRVRNLPLSRRNWDDLLGLIPGVHSDRYTEEGGGTAAGRTGGANVHGVRSLQNNFLLDGVDNNSISTNVQELTTQIVRPSVDSIQEFKVTTNAYSAEYGRSPGAAISVTTKSGTNQFRGVVYEFLRNRKFDANNWVLNRSGQPKPQHIQNQFGGNLGGPIVRDRAFFFFDYEGTRIRKGTTRLGSVPLANERRGDFSPAAAAANRTSYAPLVDRVGDCMGRGMPFPGNQIPATCFDPVAKRILDMLPEPNLVPAAGPLNTFNFVRSPSIVDDTDAITTREDFPLSSAHQIFFRYSWSDRFRYVPGVFGGVLDGTSTSAFGRLFMGGQSAVLGLNSALGPRLVNEFRLSWGRNNSRGVQDPFGKNTLAEFGIRGVPEDPSFSGGLPALRIQARGGTPTIPGGAGGGLDHIGSPVFLPKWQITNLWQTSDVVSLIRGPHQLKFGADLRMPMRNIYVDIPAPRGDWTFDGNRTGIGLADFLLGYPSAAQLSNLRPVDLRLWMMSYFYQHDWKLNPRLTLNFGLRYDFATWPYEGGNRMTNVDPATGNRFTPANSPFGRSLVRSDKNNFAPRVGLAWQIGSRTVLRAGYGRFYMLFERAGSEDQMGLNLPWVVNNAVGAASVNETANNMRVRTGFNLSLDPAVIENDPARLRLVRQRAVNPDSVIPTVDKWSFGLQQRLPADLVLSLDYVGTKGTHLSVLRNLNQQRFNPDGSPGGLATVRFPALGAVEYRENSVNSHYHGLDASLDKRFSRGVAFGLAYTFSKSIDYAMEHLFSGGSSSFMQNAHNLKEQRGRSDFDYRHRLVLHYNYEPPLGKGGSYLTQGPGAWLLGNWRISGITVLRSGRPFTIFYGANNGRVGVPGGLANALADRLRDGNLPADQRKPDRWFDQAAFAPPPEPRVLGNCGRNILDGPGAVNFDFALARTFPYFGEGRSLEFRWEVFNAFNTPQFGLPDNNRASGAFGTISRLAGDARLMQFALKFYY